VLYVTHRFPYPPNKGDRIRNYHLLRYLADRADVWLATFADEPVPRFQRDHLLDICQEVFVVEQDQRRWLGGLWSALHGGSISAGLYRDSRMSAGVRYLAEAHGFDLAVASSSAVADYLRPLSRTTTTVVDMVDLDSAKWADFARGNWGPRGWVYALEAARMRRLEVACGTWADGITFVSQHETNAYRQLGGVNGHTVANGVDLQFFRARVRLEEPPPGVVFVGAMDYWPNVAGVTWFTKQVWPKLRAHYPDLTFTIVGRRPTPVVQRLAAVPGVSVTGDVPDVRPFLDAATVSVAPLQLGRGLQNKVLEALANGVPTVATPTALAGLTAMVGRDVFKATTPDEWLTAISAILDKPKLRERLRLNGRRYAEQQHDWTTCLAPFGRWLHQGEKSVACSPFGVPQERCE
jgi:sugar transferase (PEP-CTERM/EpsH1 system associated)